MKSIQSTAGTQVNMYEKCTVTIVTQKIRSIHCNGSLVSPMQSGHHSLLEDRRCYHVHFYIAKDVNSPCGHMHQLTLKHVGSDVFAT